MCENRAKDINLFVIAYLFCATNRDAVLDKNQYSWMKQEYHLKYCSDNRLYLFHVYYFLFSQNSETEMESESQW